MAGVGFPPPGRGITIVRRLAVFIALKFSVAGVMFFSHLNVVLLYSQLAAKAMVLLKLKAIVKKERSLNFLMTFDFFNETMILVFKFKEKATSLFQDKEIKKYLGLCSKTYQNCSELCKSLYI